MQSQGSMERRRWASNIMGKNAYKATLLAVSVWCKIYSTWNPILFCENANESWKWKLYFLAAGFVPWEKNMCWIAKCTKYFYSTVTGDHLCFRTRYSCALRPKNPCYRSQGLLPEDCRQLWSPFHLLPRNTSHCEKNIESLLCLQLKNKFSSLHSIVKMKPQMATVTKYAMRNVLICIHFFCFPVIFAVSCVEV